VLPSRGEHTHLTCPLPTLGAVKDLRVRHCPVPTIRTFFGAAGIAGGCVTTTLCPATTIVVVRSEAVVFPVKVIATVPLPFPVPPLVMLNHEADSDADHVQPPPAVTAIVVVPPTEGTATLVGATVNVQGAASWVTVTV
jgi:hypothetical protein